MTVSGGCKQAATSHRPRPTVDATAMSLSSAWISCRAPGSGGRGGSHAMLPQFDTEPRQAHVQHQHPHQHPHQQSHQQHSSHYAHAHCHQHQAPASRMHVFGGGGVCGGGLGNGGGGGSGSCSGALSNATMMAMMPAQLPARSSPLRAIAVCVLGFACLVASLVVLVAAVDPMAQRGSTIVAGMGAAVGSAIARANEAAERNAQAHYRARDEYLQRRGLRRIDDDAFPMPGPAAATAELEWSLLRGGEDDALDEALQKWETLREVGSDEREVINANAVRRNFPGWFAKRPRGAPWDEQLVLRDVVLAVSRLAAEHRRQQEGGGGQYEGTRTTSARERLRETAEAATRKTVDSDLSTARPGAARTVS